MTIEPIRPPSATANFNDLDASEAVSSPDSFSKYLQKSVNEVNDLLANADKQAVAVASGRSENLHQATISTEKAETALKLLVQVRNKAIDAYHEIMRMQL